MTNKWLDALERWQPTSTSPPRLYFGAEDVDALRARTGAFPLLWERIRSTALSALEVDPEPRENQVYTIRHWLGVAGTQALVGLVDNWPALQHRAWELLQIAFEHEDWVIKPHKPLRVDLFYAAVCAELGQLYDWLYPILTSAQRDQLVDELKRRIAPFEAITAREAEDWDVHHWVIRNMNWKSVVHSEMGIAALAVWDHIETSPAILRAALNGVLEVLDDPHTTGEDGAYTEGLSYWGYAMSRTVWFAGLLKRATDGAVDLFEHPYLRMTGDYALHMWTPDGGSFAHEDCPRDRLPHPMVMATLAAENKRGDYQWMAERSLSATVGFFGHDMLVQFLFADPALASRRPDLPTRRFFPSIETAVMRSDWTDDATFLGVHAGATAVPHSHLDIGTFTLIGRGERVIDDAGKWPYDHAAGFFDDRGPRWHYEANDTVGHNTVLVDGQGQVFGDGCKGRIIASGFTGEAYTLVADATGAYGGRLARFVRYVAYLKPDVVVIVDDLEANDASEFSWLLHTDGEATLDDTAWTFEVGGAAVDVRFLGFDELGATGGYMTGWVDRKAHYEEYNHLYVTPSNRYAVFETLHPEPAWLVPAVLRVRDRNADLPLEATMSRDSDSVTIDVSTDASAWRIEINLNEREKETDRILLVKETSFNHGKLADDR